MTTTQSAHYTIHADVPDDLAREARLRLDRTFDEYASRTKDFSRPPTDKLPFYLFKSAEEYSAAGAPKGTGGVFTVDASGARLMAFTGRQNVWHVTQHEGFHQFAYFAISKQLPLWVNEGLAEYFGESIFTGDAMLSGLIPDGRRARVAKMIASGKYHPFAEFISISSAQWFKEMGAANYDEAWSMVHFMAEGDGGRYQSAFLKYMKALASGIDPVKAWTDVAGKDQSAFEAAWKKYWTALPANPTLNKYVQAKMMLYTSFIARANAASQRFNSLQDFLAAAKDDKLQMVTDDKFWLPTSLLKSTLPDLPDTGTYSLQWSGPVPSLTRQGPDGSRTTVRYTLQDGKPRTVVETR